MSGHMFKSDSFGALVTLRETQMCVKLCQRWRVCQASPQLLCTSHFEKYGNQLHDLQMTLAISKYDLWQ